MAQDLRGLASLVSAATASAWEAQMQAKPYLATPMFFIA